MLGPCVDRVFFLLFFAFFVLLMFVVYEDYNGIKLDPYDDIVRSDAFAETRLIPQSDLCD